MLRCRVSSGSQQRSAYASAVPGTGLSRIRPMKEAECCDGQQAESWRAAHARPDAPANEVVSSGVRGTIRSSRVEAVSRAPGAGRCFNACRCSVHRIMFVS